MIHPTESNAARLQRGELVRTITHEVRTPLAAVIGFAELLQRGVVDDRHQRWASSVVQAGAYLQRIIDQVSQYALVEATDRPRRIIQFQLNDLVDEVIDAVRRNHDDIPTGIVNVPVTQVPEVAHMPEGLLRVALGQLIANAVEHGVSTSVRVRLISLDPTGKNELVRFSIANDGPKFGHDEYRQIMDAPVTGAGSGAGHLGLGLYLAQKCVAEMGGQLKVSHENGVTTCWFDVHTNCRE